MIHIMRNNLNPRFSVQICLLADLADAASGMVQSSLSLRHTRTSVPQAQMEQHHHHLLRYCSCC